MGRLAYDAEEVLRCYGGVRCGHLSRIVFPGGPILRKMYPDAAGFINSDAAIAKLYRNTEGRLCMETTEPLIPGFKPLTRKFNPN